MSAYGIMRVAQVVTDNDRRGAQVFATDLERALRDLGLDIRTVALAPGRSGGLDVELLGPKRRSLKTIRALRRLSGSVDLIIAHGSTTLPMTAVATIGTGTPFVYRQISDSLYWASSPFRRARVRWALSRASAVVALWEGAAQVLQSEFGVSRAKTSIVPNGVDERMWRPPSYTEQERSRRNLGITIDRPVVTFVGALSPEKGPDLAIETAARVPNVHLVIAGAGPEERNLKQLAHRRLGDRATFCGATTDMWSVYAATDVLLFPSRDGDSMPAVLIEAGLMRVPTVTTRVGAVSAMFDPGINGVVVDETDPIHLANEVRNLTDDRPKRESIGERAREAFLQRFELRIVARQWADVIEAKRRSRVSQDEPR